MKKLILSIAIVLTLNSCTTPDQPTTETTQGNNQLVVEELYFKTNSSNPQWVYQVGHDRPLQANHQIYNNCVWAGTIVELGAMTGNYTQFKYQIACK